MSDRPLRVLVVEDEWLIARDYVANLEAAGHVAVGPVATVRGALALLDSELVDLAVLDFRLVDETSSLVAQRLTERAIPFAVVTGHARTDLPPEFNAGEFVAKPADERSLIAALDRLAAG